ncbi:MAG: hypothetical protein JXB07_08335 [Anaerolineae bacterium]|nr:hypothetical protein [Anaerolineae bacterium]
MSNQNRSPWLIAGALLVGIMVCIICATGAGIIGLRYWLLAQSSAPLSPVPPLIIGTPVPAVTDIPTPTANPAAVTSPTTDPLSTIPVGSDWFELGKGAIWNIVLSPDRQYLAVACSEYLYIYNPLNYEELWRIPSPGPIKQINQISWSPDSHYLAVNYFYDFDAGQTVIWDVGQQAKNMTLSGQNLGISSFAWSQDGSRLASLTNNSRGSLIVWDLESGEILFSSPDDNGDQVAWSLDGQYLIHDSLNKVVVRSSEDYRIITEVQADTFVLSNSTDLVVSNYRDGGEPGVLVWNVATGETVHRLPDVELVTNSWSPDGTAFVVTSKEGEILVIDAASGETLNETPNKWKLNQSSVLWSPAGNQIFMVSKEVFLAQNVLSLWNLRDGTVIQLGESFESAVRGLAWLEPGRRMLFSFGSRAQEINVETGLSADILVGHIPAQTSAVWSPDGQTIASSGGSRIFLWSVASRALTNSYDIHNSISSLAYDPDGNRLAAFSPWNTVTIWSTRTGQVEHTLTGDNVRVIHNVMWHSALSWSPDGRYLAVGFVGHLIVWDTQTWGRSFTIPLPYDTYPAIINFSPDSQYLAYGWLGNLFTLSLQTGEQVNLLEEVYGFYWVPDGDMMALSRSLDGALLWNTSTAEEAKFSMPIYPDSSPFGSFSPSENLFAALVKGPTVPDWHVIVWDIRSGLPIERLHLYNPSDAPLLEWSPDGTHLALPSEYGTVIVWHITVTSE